MVKILKWFGIFFGVALVSFLAYDRLLKDQIFPKRFAEVSPGVFRSGQIHQRLIEDTLVEHQIDKVIDLRYWEDLPEMIAERDAIARLDLVGERYPLNGNGTGRVEHYIDALVSLHEAVQAGQPVLVHCAAGSQRTGGVFAMYRTLVQGVSAKAAVAEMVIYDWDPKKDQILLDYLNQNVAQIAQALTLAGVLSEVPQPLPVFVNPLEQDA